MSFKINLRPYPAANYFTVREHLRTFPGVSIAAHALIESVEGKIRNIFKIPANYHFQILMTSEKEELVTNFGFVVKDDPGTGIDFLRMGQMPEDEKILDLSYSFPQIPVDYDNIRSALIDPAISLGVPVDLAFLFSRTDLSLIPTNSGDIIKERIKPLSILDKVLNDYQEKGMEVLLRESTYKAAVLNQMLEDCTFFKPVAEKQVRSKTVFLAETDPDNLQKIRKMGYEVGSFMQNDKTILSIANYPTHSKELIEMFADRVVAI